MFSNLLLLGSAVSASVSGVEILLDDAGQHIRPGTAWTMAVGDCAQAGHGGGFHHNNGVHNKESFATWNFSVAKDGCYWVEEFHPETSGCDFSLASRVPVDIHFCKGLRTAGLIDQSQRGGQWNKLVKLPFYASHSAAIHISAMDFDFEGVGVWAADAFRLTWDSKSCHDEQVESDEAVAPTEETESRDPESEIKEITKEIKVALQEEANLPLLQSLVDDVDSKILHSTLEPVSQCPATAGRTFHHDALQKHRRAQATFHFNPPHDGCYLIEELHPQLEQCKASANTKVHVHYCKGLKAVGTVDQSTNAGQWTFVAALPFYAGHPGNVTLSNEGTEPGTLAVFDQVRFTWSGKSCRNVDSHPRRAKIRMTTDFKNVANRLSEFGSALKTKLAVLANVPQKALRLSDVRPGSIIAEFLVLPSVVDDPLTTAGLSAGQTMEKLRGAVAKNAADLCALTGASPVGCNVEFQDLGVAGPSIRPVQKQRPQKQQEEPQGEAEAPWKSVHGMVAAAVIGFLVLSTGYFSIKVLTRINKAKKEGCAATDATTKADGSEVTASMEEGKFGNEKKPAEDQSDNNSTLAPSSDKQSEPSLDGDAENASNPEPALKLPEVAITLSN
jgi:hypothetical protein